MSKKHKFDIQNGILINISNLDSNDHIKIPNEVVKISEDLLKKIYNCKVEIPNSIKLLDVSLSSFTHFIVSDSTKLKKTKPVVGLKLTVFDNKTKDIKFKVYFPRSDESKKFGNIVDSFFASLDDKWFERYDAYFMRYSSDLSKCEIAECRLCYPYYLSEEHLKQQENFIERCWFFEDESEWSIRGILADDEVDRLKFYAKYGAINPDNISWIMKLSQTFSKAQKCQNYLNDFYSREV